MKAPMLIRLHNEGDGSWSLYIDAVRVMEHESFQVVSNVADELQGRGPGVGECAEVAASIRTRLEQEVLHG